MQPVKLLPRSNFGLIQSVRWTFLLCQGKPCFSWYPDNDNLALNLASDQPSPEWWNVQNVVVFIHFLLHKVLKWSRHKNQILEIMGLDNILGKIMM